MDNDFRNNSSFIYRKLRWEKKFLLLRPVRYLLFHKLDIFIGNTMIFCFVAHNYACASEAEYTALKTVEPDQVVEFILSKARSKKGRNTKKVNGLELQYHLCTNNSTDAWQ